MNTDILKGLALMNTCDFVLAPQTEKLLEMVNDELPVTVNHMASRIADFENTCKMFTGTDSDKFTLVMTMLNDLYSDALEGSYVDADEGVKYQEWYRNFVSHLNACNFEVLGSGHFAMAVRHPFLGGKAVKIGFKVEDSGAAYAAYCRQQKGAYMSEVLAVKRWNDCYMVVMPEYKTLNGTIDDDSVIENDKRALRMAYRLVKQVIDYGNEDWDLLQYSMVDSSCRDNIVMLKSNINLLDSRIADFEELFNDARSIRLYFEDIAAFDIHDENVMVRWVAGRPQLVITDPVSWTHDCL